MTNDNDETVQTPQATALRTFVETIDATGGVMHNDRNEVAPVADEDWVDLGAAYMEACAALDRYPVWGDDDDAT